MSDYEEDFEDVDDVVADDNELNSPVRGAPTNGRKRITGTISSGEGAEGKGAGGAISTQEKKKSSELKEKMGGEGVYASTRFEDLLKFFGGELRALLRVILCICARVHVECMRCSTQYCCHIQCIYYM